MSDRIARDDWHRIEELFDAALEEESGHRRAFLEHVEADEAVRREVELLLSAHHEARDFLEAPTRPSPSTIGPYRVVRELGTGGMGRVFLVVGDHRYGLQRLAVKILPLGISSPRRLRRFRREREILARLKHPYIAALLGSGTCEKEGAYLVMEYVDGVPIDDYCRQHRLAVPQRIELFRLVLSAVGFVHRNGIVHRDLKPSNILIRKDGIPKLLDFGIARMVAHAPVAEKGRVGGYTAELMTPCYASPEQLASRPVTVVSDVYSLGVVLYKLLTGHRPWRVGRLPLREVERMRRETAPLEPSRVVLREARESEEIETVDRASLLSRELRGEIDRIVLRALATEPERRYGSVEELSEALGRYLTSVRGAHRPAWWTRSAEDPPGKRPGARPASAS